MINLAIDLALEIGHFLGPLVHQQKNEDNLRMIHPNRFGDFLEQNRFADTRRRNDQPPLAVAKRCEQIDSPRTDRIRLRIFEHDPALRKLRR